MDYEVWILDYAQQAGTCVFANCAMFLIIIHMFLRNLIIYLVLPILIFFANFNYFLLSLADCVFANFANSMIFLIFLSSSSDLAQSGHGKGYGGPGVSAFHYVVYLRR